MQYVVDIRQGSIRHVVSGILAVAPLSPPSSLQPLQNRELLLEIIQTSALPKKKGVYPCLNFLALFHQVNVPKFGTLLLKTNDICMFSVIITIKITIIILL